MNTARSIRSRIAIGFASVSMVACLLIDPIPDVKPPPEGGAAGLGEAAGSAELESGPAGAAGEDGSENAKGGANGSAGSAQDATSGGAGAAGREVQSTAGEAGAAGHEVARAAGAAGARWGGTGGEAQAGAGTGGAATDYSCNNSHTDGSETDVDCGGDCAPCNNTRSCLADSDCSSTYCPADSHECATPTCSDGVQNGDETGTDCGGTCPSQLCCGTGLTNSNGVCCATGLTGCGGDCVDTDSSDAHCGTCTNSCSDGKVCSAGSCTCPEGTSDCGLSGCVNTSGSDANNCGACGKVCLPGQRCDSGNCQCSLGALECNGCLGWDFESSTQSWIRDSDPHETGYSGGAQNGAAIPTWSTTHVCLDTLCPDSTHSLQVDMSMDMQAAYEAGVAVPICPAGGTADLSGRTVTAYIYFEGTEDFGVLSVLQAMTWGLTGQTTCNLMWGTSMTVNHWIPASCQFSSSLTATHLAIVVKNSGDAWNGTLYIDNVEIN